MQTPSGPGLLDPRGPRFAAWITTVVLVVVLVLAFAAPLAAGIVLLVQTLVFAVGAAAGPRSAPYGILYRLLLAPRLGRPDELEPAAPVRFAQVVGLIFGVVGTIGFLAGSVPVGVVATALALVAAFLNAAFGLCLGCEMYLGYRRVTRRPVTARVSTTP
ncbi:MAG: DUF4395 domain-containing protein [Actinocatenispora sp.]